MEILIILWGKFPSGHPPAGVHPLVPPMSSARSPLMPVVCMGGNLSRVRLMPVS